jgi:ABC-type Zn uptake system ZnuABC Zn-binding protein ZnuA
MSKQTINGDEVEVKVFAPDGTMEASAALTERELATVQAADAALKTNPEFQAAYPDARLEGVESMRGMDEHQEGRYYLRYHSASGATEFWGHVSRKPKIDFKL